MPSIQYASEGTLYSSNMSSEVTVVSSMSGTPGETVQRTRSRVQWTTESLAHEHRMVNRRRVDAQLYERIVQRIFLPLQQ